MSDNLKNGFYKGCARSKVIFLDAHLPLGMKKRGYLLKKGKILKKKKMKNLKRRSKKKFKKN